MRDVHVLVVDDEALIRWSVSETLKARGMAVSQAGDGASAAQLLDAQIQPFDAVVMDLRLPDVDDLSLLADIRERSPQSRIIVMTAFGTPAVMANAIQLGAARFISKPFDLDALGALVDLALISNNQCSREQETRS